MIRLLGKEDEETALALLDREHATNLILISDIVEYGMENQGRIFDGDYFGAFEGGEAALLYLQERMGRSLPGRDGGTWQNAFQA